MSSVPAIPGSNHLPEGARPRLVVESGVCPNVEYQICEGVNWVGCSVYDDDRHVDINLEGQVEEQDEVSPEHARITLEGNELFIEDLPGSTGTSVNSRGIPAGVRQSLPINARIQIGSVLLLVRV